jgi:hypothetical protein
MIPLKIKVYEKLYFKEYGGNYRTNFNEEVNLIIYNLSKYILEICKSSKLGL